MRIAEERLEELFGKFSERRVLVLGDLMLDEFIRGKVSRISPEAPVPIVEVQTSTFYPGGASNVARNLCAFTQHSAVVGVVGLDAPGWQLIELLKEEKVQTQGILFSPDRPTTHKMRVFGRQQQIVRVDRESREPLAGVLRQELIAYLIQEIPNYDAIVLEDYGKGLIGQELVDVVVREGAAHQKIVAVDPNPQNSLNWQGATVVKPNRAEAFHMAGLPFAEGKEAVEHAARILQERWQSQYLLLTLSEAGMYLFERGRSPYHTPTIAREVFDVSGAGDTVIAIFTLALAAGATGAEAAELANHAAGVVVGKLGTATLTPQELRESFRTDR